MIKAIKGRNCELADPLVVCAPIPKAPIEGGYNHERRQVLVNSLVIKSQSDALTLLLHELTHAYDACRVYVDPGNCRHSACSEVRDAAIAHARQRRPNAVEPDAAVAALAPRRVAVAGGWLEGAWGRCHA